MSMKTKKPIIIKKNLRRTAGFFILFALLCGLFYIPCFFYMKKIVRSRSIEQCQNYLDNKIEVIDTSLKSIDKVDSILTGTGTSLSHAFIGSKLNSLNLSHTRELLVDYFLPYNFITDYGILYEKKPVLNRYMVFFEREPLHYTQFLDSEDPEYLDRFNASYGVIPETVCSVKGHGTNGVITVYTRLYRQNETYLYVQYSAEELYHLLLSDALFEDCQAEITYNGNLMSNHGDLITDEYTTIVSSCSKPYNICVTIRIPEKYLEEDIRPFTQLAYIFMACLLAIFGIFIILFSYMSSKPYNTASEALYRTGHIDASFDRLSSTDFLTTAVNHLDSKLSNYSSVIESQKEENRIQVFERALYRGLFSSESYLLFQEMFPELPKDWKLFLVQWINNPSGNYDIGTRELCEQLKISFSPSYCQPYSPNAVLLILKDSAEESLRKFCDTLSESEHMTLSIHNSESFHDPSDLYDAFQQIEYSLIIEKPDNQKGETSVISLNMHYLQTIYYALEAGDCNTALTALQHGSADFVNSKDRIRAKHAYHALSYMLLELELEKTSLEDIAVPTFNGDRITDIFCREFPECFRQIAESIAEEKRLQMNNIENRIIEFINENYKNQQFSLITVTDHFHISAPTLQKHMNSSVGMTFSSYLETLRMKKARHLLFSSDSSIQEIAEAIGYTNTNSFYKAYKRVYGESPRMSRKTP